jgi:photosystem II stability/assembly factor-like uncharacterized protein
MARRYKLLLSISLSVTAFSILAQTADEKINSSYQARKKLAESSVFKNYPARNIGPTVQGGRIVDIDVNLKNTKEYYVAYASGGLFKTRNNGGSFEPIFDNNDAIGIGDFALSQLNPDVLYVGTGEKNSSRSSYAGSGVYKTTDGGKTWNHLGLSNTQHISRVVIHPQNDNTVWVAAIGSLYTNNSDRGVFKSTDGGKSWKKTLFINDSTGVIDLLVNPQNPNQLLASSWERGRKAWNFKGNGPGSAIYKSDDGGETWTKSSTGFPQGKQVGRIGLELCASKPNVVYAILDNQAEVEDQKKEKPSDKLTTEQLKNISKEDFLKLDDKKLEEFLRDNNYPKKYSAEVVKKDVREGKYTTKAVTDYLGDDANANLFRTKILGAEIYRSDDGGTVWKKMNSYDLDGVFFTYGYYFAEMEVSPSNADLIYIYGVPLLKSRDGGVSWHRIDTLRGTKHVHVDHHALWINPNDHDHMLLGNDGGLYVTYDQGATWDHINNTAVGQFYTVSVDMETPYNVYGGLQDNGVLKGSSRSVVNQSRDWETILGGDGMYVYPDPRNSKLVYAGFQFGNYYRIEGDRSRQTRITPAHNIGEPALRWNWRAPILLSKQNPDIVYMASNKVHRSFDKGETWEVISPDLTKNKTQGNVPFSTISSFAESPLKFGLLYVGTDDGNVWVNKDGWTSISAGLPENKWVSSITPSSLDEGTVFVSLNGYRDDDFNTYVFMSNDYGKTWKSIKGNLPESVANVVIPDPVNADILYCGLDNGTYVSVDRGATWNILNHLKNIPSYDMVVHPRENELVVATHGRSVYIVDVKPLQTLIKNGGFAKSILAFSTEGLRYNERWGEKNYPWDKVNTPAAEIFYYVGKPSGSVGVEVYDDKNNLLRKLSADGSAGFHSFKWDVKIQQAGAKKGKGTEAPAPTGEAKYAGKGKYKLKFLNGSESSDVTVEVK